jgi:hypothetical protein
MMKRILESALVVGVVCGLIASAGASGSQARQSKDSIASSNDISKLPFKLDHVFVEAMVRKDAPAAGQLLDADFTWTDSQGQTLTRAQVLRKLPSPALGDESRAIEQEGRNNRIVIHRSERGKIYVLRVWVKRAEGWRALVYQEVTQLGTPPHSDSGAQSCENPCKNVPFKPKTEDEREVIRAYQQVESAVTAHDSAAWGAHIADEFFAVTSNSDHPLDRASRMAGLDQQKQGGIAPFPLVSARMFKFGDTMIMTSRQQPEHDKALHVTRIWMKRNGKWLEVFSYQTTIQGPAR